jgi:hypothetical protein
LGPLERVNLNTGKPGRKFMDFPDSQLLKTRLNIMVPLLRLPYSNFPESFTKEILYPFINQETLKLSGCNMRTRGELSMK